MLACALEVLRYNWTNGDGGGLWVEDMATCHYFTTMNTELCRDYEIVHCYDVTRV